MAHQYFEDNRELEHDQKIICFILRGKNYNFITDNGVFSKNTIDFGSYTLIESIDFADLPDGNLLDLGCGYGPMGISLANENPERTVDMSDVNERALDLAKENAKLNNVENVNIFQSDIYENITDKYAAIYTNPPIRAGKIVVSTMISDAKKYLNKSGQLWVVIQKKQGAPSAKKLMDETFGNVEIVKKNKGYYILKSVMNDEETN